MGSGSGSSVRTVVVRSCMKNAPLWMERKCETYRQKLSRSPVMTKPAVCCRSRPVSLTRLPVAKK